MTAPDVKAVIFDCDGTLVDSEELALGALAELATDHGLAPELASQLESMQGEAMSVCLGFIAKHASRPLPPTFESLVRERMAERFRVHLKPMPGARRLVESLRLPICVATNGPRSRAELTLGITGMLSFFEGRIYSAPEVGSFKPSPALFLFAAAAMNMASHECAVVEDSWPGMQAGLAAGMRVYTVRGPRPLAPELSGRVRLLDRLEDLHADIEMPHGPDSCPANSQAPH